MEGNAVGTTLSERWARYITTKARPWHLWMFWAVAVMWLGLSIQAGCYGQRVGFVGCGLLAMMKFLVGFVWWKRLGVQRLLEARDAEIKRLQSIMAFVRRRRRPHAMNAPDPIITRRLFVDCTSQTIFTETSHECP